MLDIFEKKYDNNLSSNELVKINKNIISAIHSIGCTFLSILAYNTSNIILTNILVGFSVSYFVWDSYFIVIKKDTINYPFLFHHAVTTLVLELIFRQYYHKTLLLFVLFGELSNFPNYLVYHLLKTTDKNSKSLYYWRHIQIVWFLFFRGLVYGHFAINLYSYIPNYFCMILLYIMYFMGLYWGVGQMKGVYKDYYKTIKQE